MSPEEKKELKNIQPLREEYENEGAIVTIGKDAEVAVGMRVRMREGLISHGVGTVTTVLDQEEVGCCEVVWDSNQTHTRGLHIKMGNKQVCRVGKEGDYDLVLAEETVCSEIEVLSHLVVVHGKQRELLEVVRKCDDTQERTVQRDGPAQESGAVLGQDPALGSHPGADSDGV